MLIRGREELEIYLNSQKAPVSAPTQEQLMMLATSAAVPFVGFGFMDNAIMIMAGEVSCVCVYVSCVATSNTISCVRRCLCRRSHTSERAKAMRYWMRGGTHANFATERNTTKNVQKGC